MEEGREVCLAKCCLPVLLPLHPTSGGITLFKAEEEYNWRRERQEGETFVGVRWRWAAVVIMA